jgi:hypothetical protein
MLNDEGKKLRRSTFKIHYSTLISSFFPSRNNIALALSFRLQGEILYTRHYHLQSSPRTAQKISPCGRKDILSDVADKLPPFFICYSF